VNLAQYIVEATQEVFTTMLMEEVSAGAPLETRNERFTDSISSIVGMAGANKGAVAVHSPVNVACRITELFLGMEVESLDDDVKDAMGELANMITGNVKGKLEEQGQDIRLSIPTTVDGDNYTVECPGKHEGTIVPFSFQDCRFLVEIHFE
jgi:chemotaxis protein CheX